MAEPRPLALRKEGETGLVIDWDDGHHGIYTWQHLRKNCPCASCRDIKEQAQDPFHILSTKEMAPKLPLKPTAMTPVGHYAYKFAWNDGHDTGIYTLEHLRGLCECEACRKQ